MAKITNSTGGRAGTRWWSLPFTLAVALLALLWVAGPAQAHGEWAMRAEKIVPVLGEQPEELDGVTTKVEHNELGWWVTVENDTGKTLEVYDAKGKPFLRIGPDGVEGNRSAAEYYVTKLGGNEATPTRGEMVPDSVTNNPDAEDDWVRVNDEPQWGWFDQRVDTENMDVTKNVPKEARQAREAVDVGQWSIPVRLGDVETEMRGTYHYDPPLKGAYVARLTSQPKSPDINVQLAPGGGGAADALFLQNRGKDPVIILGDSGEPAIRIGPEDVQINVNSPVGYASDPRNNASATSASNAPSGVAEEAPKWETVAGGSNFAWLDPRIWQPAGEPEPPDNADASSSQEVAQWGIPMEVAGEEEWLTGVTEWKPDTSDITSQDQPTGFWGLATGGVGTVVAVTVIPAVVILILLVGPRRLYKRIRYRR